MPMFSKEILLKNKIPKFTYKKKDVLFRENETAVCLYYLMDGEIKIYNTDSEGKEFLITKVTDHQFLGEPPFLLNEKYPATANIASDTALIYKFSQESFRKFLEDNPDYQFKFLKEIAQKAYDKTIKLKSIVHQNPCERIIAFLRTHKKSTGIKEDEKTIIDVTRKELANSTGLAIETVIRTVKKMEREQKIELINHKIYF